MAEALILTIGVLGVCMFFLGIMLGRAVERADWITRAMPPGQTAHHCEGKFYAVIEEGYFLREYQRKPADEEPIGLTEYQPHEGE